MQNILTLETTKYAIKLQNFEGPLDLLCHLIDKNKMDICDIKISEITDQYIEYINTMEQMNLEITSEFIFMASTLLYLKSKHLLPSGEDEEKEISEEELIRRIIEYKKYKEISKKLNEYYKENCKRFYKLTDKKENYTVADKVKVMFKELIRKKRFVFNNLFALNKCNKKEVVTAFSGLLELSRRSKVTTNQQEIFGDILVEKVKKNV